MRVSGEEISVVQRAQGDEQVPVSFVWRGRSYVVREVLGAWSRRTSWWRDLAAAPGTGEASGAASGAGEAGPAGFTARDLEERVWRVAASSGSSGQVGVYEVGHARRWRLLRISD